MTHFLVLGAGGTQGGAVARRLVRDGHAVRGLSRTGVGDPGVDMLAGDLADPAALRRAFDGITHASVTLPLVHDPDVVDGYTRGIIDAAREAGVERIVFNAGCRVPEEATDIAAFESRRDAARAFLGCGIPTAVLHPAVYLDNLGAPWVWQALVGEGVLRYPLPAELPVSWLSSEDLAAITVSALQRPELTGAFDIGGEALTGARLAEAFSAVLATPVRYEELPAAAFEQGLAAMAGPDTAKGVADIYRWVARPGRGALYAGDPAAAAGGFGVALRPVGSWVALAEARAEVHRQHEVIQGVLSGALPQESTKEFAAALDPEFRWTDPDGTERDRDATVAGLRAMHGTAPGLSVTIHDVDLVAAADGVTVVTYAEWQRRADDVTGRCGTAVLTRADGLRWRHLRETWLQAPSTP